MKRLLALACAVAGLVVLAPLVSGLSSSADEQIRQSLESGNADPKSMSVLVFSPDGILFIGDSKGGAVFAVETKAERNDDAEPIQLANVEAAIAARLGTKAEEVMIHDLAVHPVSYEVYLSVSRGRGDWESIWQLPNHVADAGILLKVTHDGAIEEVALDNVRFARIALPNPVAADKKHPFMTELSLRTDTITDMALSGDTLFVAGLSNEEFASALWRVPVPFEDGTSATTVEIYHGAHGTYETHAPIRTFVPYELGGEQHILAAYLCTPLSLFKVKELQDETHLRGRTIAEFGSGNYPLDMVVVEGETSDRIIIANSNLPLIIVDSDDIEAFDGQIIEQPEQYSAGVEHVKRSGTGIQQLDLMDNRFLVTLQRMPNGSLDLGATPLRRG